MKIKTTLNNGIALITHHLKGTHSVTISISFKTGSLYENSTNNGISHLVEHLFFRKWDNLTQSELYFEMMKLGAEIVGKTYNDYVCFSITVVPEFFTSAFNLIIKCFNRFYWTERDVLVEKKVVCNQIENHYQSYREWQDYNYFKNTKYEMPIMGTTDSVNKLTLKGINEWKDKFFCCNNSCVTITGNYNEKDLISAKQKLLEITNYGKVSEPVVCLPNHFNKRNRTNRYNIIYNDSDFTDISIFYDVNLKYEYETVRLLCAILGEGCGSVLSEVLRETKGFVDDIYTDLICFSGFYRLSISFTVKNINFLKCMKYFFEIISNFKTHIYEKEYSKSIVFFTRNQTMDFDSPETLNNRYALCDFILKSALSEPIEIKEKYEQISPSNIQMYASEILTESNISFLVQTCINDKLIKRNLERYLKTRDGSMS